MTQLDPASFVAELRRQRAAAIIRSDDQARAASAMAAAIAGGFRIVEFTLTTPGAYDLIREFSRRDGVIVGAGTVLSTDQVARSVEAGARYIVSPIVDEAVIRAAGELGVAAMPGAHTPTEMMQAHRAGAQVIKLFPAAAGGPTYVKSVLAPLPFLHIVPTNGVDESNAAAYLAAGAAAVAFVNSLFTADAMARSDWNWVENRARALLALIR
jgi:2-dehydro-3-deoxyphosphogluconate aldolase/(4S)-4-hydroxy-2-oxoglutarate aldolase